MSDSETHEWWQTGIIYQIYPRSFMDGDGDGVGDLRGIVSKLDYLQWLGVTAVWLSPIYPSPMADFGYDISDYIDIDPLFGSLSDFELLAKEVHRRKMKLVLDLVPNHSSDQHAWFKASRSSRDNPKRNWYIWRDPAPGGGPPNNWLSNFGGSAWTLDEKTGQYYYHAFLNRQPDLNWRNPEVREAMHDVMRFWLDHGVDGFRVDVIWHMIKDEDFRDNPRNEAFSAGDNPYHEFHEAYTTDQPEVHDVIAGMRQVLEEYPERMMVGEIYLPVEKLVTYYGEGGSGAHLPFNFQLVTLDWHAPTIAAAIDKYEGLLPSYGWPNWVLGNHDRPRIAARTGREQARVAGMLLLTLRGTPTMYYGDEIGMTDVPIPRERVQDPLEKNVPGKGLGRDPCRTPMQWNDGDFAGFTTGLPWLPLADDYKTYNVEVEQVDPESFLSFYRRLIALRQSSPALTIGSYRRMPSDENLIVYLREQEDSRFLIALNFSGDPREFTIEEPLKLTSGDREATIVLTTHRDREPEPVTGRRLSLRPNEGVVVELP